MYENSWVKALAQYTRNCKDFSNESLWKLLPVYKTVEKKHYRCEKKL